MIKFRAHQGKRRMLGFGLTERNLELLKQDKPIHIDLRELGLPDYEILIFYGKTEDEIAKALFDLGVLDEVNIIDSRKGFKH